RASATPRRCGSSRSSATKPSAWGCSARRPSSSRARPNGSGGRTGCSSWIARSSVCADNRRMRIRFTKMQGAGNDFVVLDETKSRLNLTPEQYRRLADRHFGVGADQVLSVRPSPAPGVDFEYVIHNADGGEVEQCGNGARCFARYVADKGLTRAERIKVQTLSGVIEPRLNPDGRVTVDMGKPIFE